MSYCSLEEAWGGDKEKCSRVNNKKGTTKNTSYKITNKNNCNKKNKETFSNIGHGGDSNLDNDILGFADCDPSYSSLSEMNDDSICNNVNSSFTNNSILFDANNNNTPTPLTNENTLPELGCISDYDNNYFYFDENNKYNNNNDQNVINNNTPNNTPNNNVNINNQNDKNVRFNMNNHQIESAEQEEIEQEEIEQEESIEQENTFEGFANKTDDNIEAIKNINDRLTAIEARLNASSSNNVHDIILYIIIGVFILFALDSIFRIGRGTV